MVTTKIIYVIFRQEAALAISMQYHLSAPGSFVLGKPMMIKFSLKNLATSKVWVLKWYTPLAGLKGKIIEVTRDGVPIPYEGRLVKRGRPEPDDYIPLIGGLCIHAEFDLARDYALRVCHECRVKFKGRISGVACEEISRSRSTEEHFSIAIPGNEIIFAIIAGCQSDAETGLQR